MKIQTFIVFSLNSVNKNIYRNRIRGTRPLKKNVHKIIVFFFVLVQWRGSFLFLDQYVYTHTHTSAMFADFVRWLMYKKFVFCPARVNLKRFLSLPLQTCIWTLVKRVTLILYGFFPGFFIYTFLPKNRFFQGFTWHFHCLSTTRIENQTNITCNVDWQPSNLHKGKIFVSRRGLIFFFCLPLLKNCIT